MFTAHDSASLTLDELTWLSASTLIENQYALSESASSERDARALLHAVFRDSTSDISIETDDEGPRSDENLTSHSNQNSPPPMSSTSPRRTRGSPELTSATPGTNSPAHSSIHDLVGTGSPFQSGRQPITPPPTPPRRHLYPRNLSHDYPFTSTPPSPSPSVSSSTLSSVSRTHQTEWIYRRPKSSSPANNALMSRHRSPSTSASCTPQLSRSPSISSRTYRDSATTARSSKYRQHAAVMPRPSSPVLISSTSQLVDAPGPEPTSRSPSISSNATGLRSAASASVSSLQLQSSIRVSPLKNRAHGPSFSPVANFPVSGSGAAPPCVERCPSNTSVATNNSTGTAIWSALRAKSGSTPERNRSLKSIPSRSQINVASSVRPTFTVPQSSSLPISSRDLMAPRLPPKDRHTLSGAPSISSSFSQKDKDRHTHRRDKFASAPPIPVPIVGPNTASARPSPSIKPGANNPSSASSLNNTMGVGASTSPSSPSGASNSTIRMSSNSRSRNPRDRTTSLTSQCSITTATTTHTAATTGTTSSSSSSRLHPYTPTTPSSIPVPVPAPGIYNFRSSSNSSTSTPPSYLHGLGGEKKQFHQHRHQRQASTSSSTSINSGSTAAAVAARSLAYAQLTGTSNTKRRRPSTSPGSDTSSFHPHPYSRQIRPGIGGSSATGHGNGLGGRGNNGSATTLMPFSLSSSAPYHPPIPPPPAPSHSSSVSLSHYGNSHFSRSPRIPLTPHAPRHHPLPKAKSILTRTSSMSTKNSGCGGTIKSVKFVEIPEVHYRSGLSEEDGNEYIYGYGCNTPDYDDEEDENDGGVTIGAKGEGQEGMVLRDCMGIDVETIDMDIDTYLGNGSPEEEEKETKLTFKRRQGLGWNFLSRSKKQEREVDKDGETKDVDREPMTRQKKEKEKSSSGLGLKKLMGLTIRKAPPPPLSLSISSSFSPSLRSPTTSTQEDTDTSLSSKKQSTTPPISPSRKPISGPYILGSHLPSRSPPTHLPLPSPSSSLLHHPTIPTRSIPASSSNTSLNRLNGSLSGHYFNHSSASINHGNTTHRARSVRSAHQRVPSLTTATGLGTSTERPVGPNPGGTRPKGITGADVLSLNATPIPLTSAPSYESFRSVKSYGGRSVRSEVGSVKSSKSAGAGSMRSFRTWMNKVGATVGGPSAGVPVAVAE